MSTDPGAQFATERRHSLERAPLLAQQDAAPGLVRRLPVAAYLTLDTWRAVASLWVVLVHSCLPNLVGSLAPLASVPVYAFMLKGSLGVQMFFVISGYCIASAASSSLRKQSAAASFGKARLRRIYPPYFAAFALFAIASLLARHVLNGRSHQSAIGTMDVLHQSLIWYFANASLLQLSLHQSILVFVAWTLDYEVLFYGLAALAVVAAARWRGEQSLMLILHGMTFLSAIYIIVRPFHVVCPFNLLPQFGIGIAAYDWLTHPESRRGKVAFAVIAVLLLCFAGLYNFHAFDPSGGTRLSFTFVVAFALAIVALHRWDRKLATMKLIRFTNWLGESSYSLYLTLILALGMVMQAARRLRVTEHNFFMYVILQVVAALVLSRIFYRYFERPFISSKLRAIYLASGDRSFAPKNM